MFMSKAMEDMCAEILNEYKKNVACRMLEKGKYSLEEIVTISELKIEDVKSLVE